MRVWILTILIAEFFTFRCFSQKEGNVWLFDKNLGIDFNEGEFTSFNTIVEINQDGATAVLSDKNTGRMLFFTNGRTVWDASFNKMINGTGLRGGTFTHQAAIIVPYPGASNKYFLFTCKSTKDLHPEGKAGLYANLIDMAYSNGLGRVTEKNALLNADASEKLIAIPHSNGVDYWLISHEGTTDRFMVFPITISGVGAPVFTAAGPSYDYYRSRGWLQASPDGTMLACAVSSDGITNNPLELYDFDKSTGQISNRRELGQFPELTGVSFSPNNTKLYFTFSDQMNDARGYLSQMDLNAGSTSDIISSRKDLFGLHDAFPNNPENPYDTIRDGVLQLAPDGRLYIKAILPYRITTNGTSVDKNKIYFLRYPNQPGLASEPAGRDFNGSFDSPNGWSLPNFMPYIFNGLESEDNEEGGSCLDKNLTLFPNPLTSLLNIDLESGCSSPVVLEIYNTLGQLISEHLISEPFYTVDMTNLATGAYFAVFRNSNDIISRRIIKK